MQIIGNEIEDGLSFADLSDIAFDKTIHDLRLGLPANLRDQAKPAGIAILKGGVAKLAASRGTFTLKGVEEELSGITYDQHALMGRGANRSVKCKHARYNVCIGNTAQDPDYINGKGRIEAFADLPNVNALKDALETLIGAKCPSLVGEVNFYYDVTKTGIGYHGDGERKFVIGIRVGDGSTDMPLKYRWHQKCKPVGSVMSFHLEDGDIYIMDEMAVGTNWLKDRRGFTLRHAAGCDKYAADKR